MTTVEASAGRAATAAVMPVMAAVMAVASSLDGIAPDRLFALRVTITMLIRAIAARNERRTDAI